MQIINALEALKVETPHKVDVRKLYDQENAQVMLITLQPGESLKPHITPVDVFFYVLEGSADIRVGDETQTVGRDHLVESPKDIPHNLSNSSTAACRVLVVKAPRQSKPGRRL